MDFNKVMTTRRSVRTYKPDSIERTVIDDLLRAAAQAPSAMNQQNWAFGVIQGEQKVREYGDRARQALLRVLDEQGATGDFRDRVASPDFRPFYNATALVVIYATADDQFGVINCTLAAENLMLAAREHDLGSCWIGMGSILFNEPDVKKELGVPEGYAAVAPIIMGYPDEELKEKEKHPPTVLFWQS